MIGTPTASGVTTLTITVTDALGSTASASPTLTIDPAPANYTIRDESQGKISAIGAGYLLVGTKKIVWDANTAITVNEAPKAERATIGSFVKVGMKVQWKGLRDAASGTVLTSKLEIN